MDLKNGVVLLVIGTLAFAVRKRGRPSLFGRFMRPQPSPSDSPDLDSAESLDPDSAEEVEREVRALLARGRKIEAVKYVREYTNWGLKASKEFVDALENDAHASAAEAFSEVHASQPVDITGEVQVQVRAYLQQGRMIEAIKYVREETGWGLKQAKDYVDSLR